jgi:hypothetical protein
LSLLALASFFPTSFSRFLLSTHRHPLAVVKMVNVRNPFKRQDSVSGALDPATLTSESHSVEEHRVATPEYEKDEKDANGFETKAHAVDGPHLAPGEGFMDHVEQKDVLANGKERPIEVRSPSSFSCGVHDDGIDAFRAITDPLLFLFFSFPSPPST